MNKTELITHLMDEYKAALQAIEAKKAWKLEEDERIERLKMENRESGRPEWDRMWRKHYEGRHVPKAELNRIRLMLQKAMLEVERG